MKLSTRDLTSIALSTAVICILAQFTVPLPFTPVPITGQSLGVFLAGALLGGKKGMIAVISYLLLGATGLPVFAAGRGGLQVLLGPTGGYLLGFIPGVYVLGKLVENRTKKSLIRWASAMMVCLALSYLWGATQLSLVMNLNLTQTVITGILPYLPGDLIKLIVTVPLAQGVRRQLVETKPGFR